ncbi:MAG: hypothetical protein ACPLXP_00525 [Microgenomates group bacterium]
MGKIKRYKTLIFIFLIFAASFFSWRSLTFPGYFSMHDDMQFMRIYQMDKCVKDGQIPCRWVPDLGFGYGYPLFNYYSPFPYYLGEIFHLLGFSIINSVKVLFGLGLVLSAIFMFFLAREFWGDLGGLLSAVFYIYAPYRAVDVYVRGAMAEHWGMVWFPLIFLAVYKIIKEENKIWILILGISGGLLFLSHNISSMIFSLTVGAWALFWLLLEKKFGKIKDLILGGLLALGISAFFVLPLIFEKKFVHIETMLMGYFNYLAHFADLHQLFLSNKWGWGASVWGPGDEMPFMIGYLHWGLVLANFLFACVFWLKKKNKLFLFSVFLAGFFLLTAFMTHSRSTFIWQKIKFLEYLQFPWRFLALVAFFSSFFSGAIACFAKNKKIKSLLLLLLGGGVIFLNAGYFKPEKYFFEEKDEDRLQGKKWQESLNNAIFDYLPIYAHYPPGEEAPKLPQVISGKGEILDFQKGTNWQKFKIKAEEPSRVQLSLYYFPEWKVWTDGKETKIDYNNFYGLITFDVAEGEYQIKAKLLDTPIRKMGNTVSLLSILILGIAFIKKKEK